MSEIKENHEKFKKQDDVVNKLKTAVANTKIQYLSVMETIKQLNEIAESVNYDIDWKTTEVKKKTIVKLLN